jgi:starch phosphorylase
MDIRARLTALAENLWWCWDAGATALFAGLDPERWEEVNHDPFALLAELPDEVLAARSGTLPAVEARLAAYLADKDTWASRAVPSLHDPVCYFSMEFALHESLPIYSGGLGVLAGDHMKSASDLGIPFVGIGLLYREGYFKQVIANGRQVVAYPPVPLETSALRKLDVLIEVPHGHHTYQATAWELKVGRARLLLLDSDLEGNRAEHRALSQQLYGGDEATRIQQEVLLGIGGVRLLRALGLRPSVLHMNEGHCAFAVLERWREEIAAGLRPGAALARVREDFVFTTHTPVPAGHDRFHWELKKEALGGMREDMGLPEGAFMDLGRVRPSDVGEPLCMTVLALRGARAANAVSALHGEVSREMWKDLWTGRALDEIPIGHVTNGVHAPSWMHPSVAALLDDHVPGWREPSAKRDALDASSIPDAPSGRCATPCARVSWRACAAPSRASGCPPTRSPSASPGASRPTSAGTCSSRTPTASRASSTTPIGPCRSFLRARPIRGTPRARASSAR